MNSYIYEKMHFFLFDFNFVSCDNWMYLLLIVWVLWQVMQLYQFKCVVLLVNQQGWASQFIFLPAWDLSSLLLGFEILYIEVLFLPGNLLGVMAENLCYYLNSSGCQNYYCYRFTKKSMYKRCDAFVDTNTQCETPHRGAAN